MVVHPNNKKIIFVGKMGVGKSSLTNMFVQGDLFKKNVREVSNSADAVTAEIEVVDGLGWTVCDTVGLGELQGKGDSKKDEAMDLLVRVLREGKLGFHYIAYVIKQGRLRTKEHAELFDLFKKTFAGAEKNFILIITHSKESWAEKNKTAISDIFGDIPVFTCDFPFDEDEAELDEHARKESLRKLVKGLSALELKPIAPKLSRESTADEAAKKQFAESFERFLGIGLNILGFVVRILIELYAH
ncbi:hypothetical protein BGZ80_006852 [Entomortierella chlamydospora]|uniref:AIG1-type G domain-containing protein n=1 Tax=Entomortierella chlamydospora TaxID=101097 RepID=A0A9P6MZP5_9FUNG|nr:hypothetical protein BGZ79_004804 [Entomortierella chlamydospora]KAG0018700.1 hypothetical protein BGZ80_006852 [Entomortierella chlamydospora]